MRLAFAVAINVDADILLIDEILAVGDVNFQAKCFDHLRELKAKGITIVIVTHDLNTIERFCDRAIWFESGKVMLEDSAPKVVDAYLNFMNQKKIETLIAEEEKQEIREKKEEVQEVSMSLSEVAESEKIQQEEEVKEMNLLTIPPTFV